MDKQLYFMNCVLGYRSVRMEPFDRSLLFSICHLNIEKLQYNIDFISVNEEMIILMHKINVFSIIKVDPSLAHQHNNVDGKELNEFCTLHIAKIHINLRYDKCMK